MYISDPAGEFHLKITDPERVSRYRQGAQLAEFILCKNCGVLMCVCYTHEGQRYATVNARILKDATTCQPVAFAPATTVSPRLLPTEEKSNRWQKLWFSQVSIDTPAPLRSKDDQS